MIKKLEFLDTIERLYCKDILKDGLRSVTLQVTEDCCCNCSYCYQTNKSHSYMTKDIAKNIIDLLFQLSTIQDENFIINNITKGLLLDFTGGEPLMNISVIDYSCEYFINKCLKLNHPWIQRWKASITSNGTYYFSQEVQNFINKFKDFLYMVVTLDGPKEIHNKCRKYTNGLGQFDDAYAAFKDCQKRFENNETKVTISPINLLYINDIVDFFIEENIATLELCPIYEHEWTIEEGRIFYQQLKQIADKKLTSYKKINLPIFNEYIGQSIPENNLNAWCGGTGYMLAFSPSGLAYPCIRYITSENYQPLIIGDYKGIYNTEYTKKIYNNLKSTNRRLQSSDECFYCPIASGCSYCCAYEYIQYGTINHRSLNNCNIHKARILANTYYWNKYYNNNNINKVYNLNLSKDEALNYITEKEYLLLIDLIESQKNKIQRG